MPPPSFTDEELAHILVSALTISIPIQEAGLGRRSRPIDDAPG
jgi:hypothetical protein